MRWIWSDAKNRTHRRIHGLSFETARAVFDDPLALSRADPHPDWDRWQTAGLVGQVVLFVVHTWLEAEESSEEPVGRIISARKATAYERKAYEQGGF